MQLLAFVCLALIATSVRGDVPEATPKDVVLPRPFGVEKTDAVAVHREAAKVQEGPILRNILDPIDWFALGMEEINKKRQFLELPDLSLDCSEFDETVYDMYYNFYKFKQCVWTGVKTFISYEEIGGINDDESYPVINEYIKFPFFRVPQLTPGIFTVSSNGYITVKPGPGTTRFLPRFEKDKKPWMVISSVFTDLAPFPGNQSKIRYGLFRMGVKVLCMKIEWFKMRPFDDNNRVDLQLDVCSNGYFIQRVKRARNLTTSQVGLNFGGVDVPTYKYSALPKQKGKNRYPSFSAIVMRPASKTVF